MNKNELEAAIRAVEHEIQKLTHEFIRKGQGYKCRMHAPALGGLTSASIYYKEELKKLESSMAKPIVKKESK